MNRRIRRIGEATAWHACAFGAVTHERCPPSVRFDGTVLCHARSPASEFGSWPGLCDDGDACESGECDERIFSSAAWPDFQIRRAHNSRSDYTGRPGLGPGTYGSKERSSD